MRKDGGIAILFGNLASEGAVVKQGAVAPEMMTYTAVSYTHLIAFSFSSTKAQVSVKSNPSSG